MFHYTFSGTAVLLGLILLCLSLTAGILWYRRHFQGGTTKASPDILRRSTTVGQLSLCAALLTTFLTINWTQYREAPVYTAITDPGEEIQQEIPITYTKPKPPPPPPSPPTIEISPDPEIEPVVVEDQAITEDTPVELYVPPVPEPRASTPPPPPEPPAPVIVDNGPVITAERMPVFGEDCKKLSGEVRKECSDRALLSFVQGGAHYPSLARENGIEGVVVISFVVEKDGTISTIEAVREQPGGLTEAVLKAVQRINLKGRTFTPGIQAGRPVRVAFNLPVKFKLSN
jgi:protein TonB